MNVWIKDTSNNEIRSNIIIWKAKGEIVVCNGGPNGKERHDKGKRRSEISRRCVD